MMSRAAQHALELRRKEQELNRLKERLMEKVERKIALDLLNPVGRLDGKRALWRTGRTKSRREEEMFRALSGQYEAQMKELAAETLHLRNVLERIGADVDNLLSPEKLPPHSPYPPPEEKAVADGRGSAAAGLTGGLWKRWECFRDWVERLRDAALREPREGEGEILSATDHDKEIAKLRLQVERDQEILSFQQQLLQEQLAIWSEPLPWGGDGLEEQERLASERILFDEQRRNFETEREAFTEAAIRLGHERKQFEEERALYIKERFLSESPGRDRKATPKWKLRTPLSALGPRYENVQTHTGKPPKLSWGGAEPVPVPPFCTPNPPPRCDRANLLPSTAELYKVLRLHLGESRGEPTAKGGAERGAVRGALFLDDCDESEPEQTPRRLSMGLKYF
ncbi:afadin- and alpha-actinin-binding protein-like [Callorhinchus milii]|nr:afadin- and alpha-actinin-binding protein-like [Callorhinchus milii]